MNEFVLGSPAEIKMLREFFWAEMDEHMEIAHQVRSNLLNPFLGILQGCEISLKKGGKILFFGNGGSASDAQHLATELTVRYVKNRPAIRAVALTTDTSALTAIGNDLGFDHLFARQIEALGQRGDVAFAISTSGTSPNIIRGLEQARKQGLVLVAFGGKDGGMMKDLVDHLLVVPSYTVARIQEMHITLGQMLCGALEKRLGLA